MTIKAVSFDAHGTLVLPHPSVGDIYAEVGALHGYERNGAELDELFLPAFRTVAKDWQVPYGSDESDAESFWHAVIDHTFGGSTTLALRQQLFIEFGYGSRWRLLPGVHEVITWLREQEIAIVICSNFDRRVVSILDDHQVDRDHTFTSAEVGVAKPDPALLFYACERLGIGPSELLHVGDNPREDAPAAAGCGCAYLEVPRGAGIDLNAVKQIIA